MNIQTVCDHCQTAISVENDSHILTENQTLPSVQCPICKRKLKVIQCPKCFEQGVDKHCDFCFGQGYVTVNW